MVVLNSSLRFFNFEGYSLEQIIVKLDETLVKRENQIESMSTDQLYMSEKMNLLDCLNKDLEKEKETLKHKIIKLQSRIEEEITSKFILFKKYESLDNELIHLKNSLTANGASSTRMTPLKSMSSSFSDSKSEAQNIKSETTRNSLKVSDLGGSNTELKLIESTNKSKSDRFVLASDTIEYEYMSLDYQNYK